MSSDISAKDRRICSCTECDVHGQPPREPRVGKYGMSVSWRGRVYSKMPRGYYRNKHVGLLHRNIYETHVGIIPHGFHVHHKNHNPEDNRVENLVALSHADHHALHERVGFDVFDGTITSGVCIECGGETETVRLTPSDYCSHRCYMRKYRRDRAEPAKYADCVICGDATEIKRGQRKLYCSPKCKARAFRRRAKECV